MSFYINPKDCDKEDWLDRNGEELSSKPAWDEIPKGKCLVVLADNGDFTAAGIMNDKKEFDRWAKYEYMDDRPKVWYLVPQESTLSVSDITMANFGPLN
jgi:hypothetical protein